MKKVKKFFGKKPDLSGRFNIFPTVSILLIAVSVILLLTALIYDRNDFTTAMLVAVALINFLTGIIIISFSGQGGINPGISAMLYPSLIINKTAIMSELNVYGDAHFIPRKMTDSRETFQFNPVGEYQGFEYNGSIFSTDDQNTAGIFSEPSSSSLMNYLKDNYSFRIPHVDNGSPDLISGMLKEVLIDTTSLCEDIDVSVNESEIIIRILNSTMFEGCTEIRKESPKCCTVSPCPMCSLVCSIITEYYGRITTLSAIRTDTKKREIMIILEVPEHQPIDEDRDNLS